MLQFAEQILEIHRSPASRPCAYEISTYALVIGDASVIQGLPLIQLAQPVPFFQQIVRFLYQLQSGSIVPVHNGGL